MEKQYEPSEAEKPITEELDFNKPDFQFVPKDTHEWRQQGPYVVCRSCGLDHATYIGMEKIMTGINEQGLPILAKRN